MQPDGVSGDQGRNVAQAATGEQAAGAKEGDVGNGGRRDGSNDQLGGGAVGHQSGQDGVVSVPRSGGGDVQFLRSGREQGPGQRQRLAEGPPGGEQAISAAADLAQVDRIAKGIRGAVSEKFPVERGVAVLVFPGKADLAAGGSLEEAFYAAAGTSHGTGGKHMDFPFEGF